MLRMPNSFHLGSHAEGDAAADWSRRKFLGRMAAGALALEAVGLRGLAGADDGAARAVRTYYAAPGRMDEGGADREFLVGLPVQLGALTAAVQGLVLHPEWAAQYGTTLTPERRHESHLRRVPEMLACLKQKQSLGTSREPDARLVGMCRHFALITVAALRAHGVPARARCGFASYFIPGKFEDHWVAECWDANEKRWRLVDPQLDELQRRKLRIDFDPLEVPRDRFVVAGAAWQRVRAGQTAEDLFGLSWIHQSGAWFVAANLVRDLAALNKQEMLPWDVWGAMPGPGAPIPSDLATTFDAVAAETLEPDAHFAALQSRYRDDARFTVPATVRNAVRGTVEEVAAGGTNSRG